MISHRSTIVLLAVAAVGGIIDGMPAKAQAPAVEKPSIKMTLEWAFQGPQAVFTSAQDNGFFRKEGLDVHLDRGSGSTDAVVKVAAGAYDIGRGRGGISRDDRGDVHPGAQPRNRRWICNPLIQSPSGLACSTLAR